MPESALDSRVKETHATTVLAVAEGILAELEASPADGDPKRHFGLLQASFLARLPAALLLEPGFPALSEGFQRLLDRDPARRAARQLAESRGRQYRSFSKNGVEPTPHRPEPGGASNRYGPPLGR